MHYRIVSVADRKSPHGTIHDIWKHSPWLQHSAGGYFVAGNIPAHHRTHVSDMDEKVGQS